MSEIVKNELDAIKAFETDTEKRRSELTLNELNYISDKQLHKKGGGSGPVDWDFFAKVTIYEESETAELLVGDFQAFYDEFSTGGSPVLGLIYDLNNVLGETPSITTTIIPEEVPTAERMLFVVSPPEPGAHSMYRLTWNSDNSLEFDTNPTGDPRV